MKKTKLEKGITLIALIITIIILLILAVVTIGSMQNSNIITYAQNASKDYNTKKLEEESLLDYYEDQIEENLPGAISNSQIAKILEGYMQELIGQGQLVEELKKEMSLEGEDIILGDIGVFYAKDNVWGFYLYKIDRLYTIDVNNGKTVSYGKEEQYPEQYNYGRMIKQIKQELENIFIGKTLAQIGEEINENGITGDGIEAIKNWVIYSSEKITEIDITIKETGVIRIDSLTWNDGENETTITKDETGESYLTCKVLRDNNTGAYYKAYIEDSH